MIVSGILVHWDNSDEYIELDIENINEAVSIEKTIEYWKNENKWVTYNTASNIKSLDNNLVEIKLSYEQENNQGFKLDEVLWGNSTIIVNLNESSGKAIWDDTNNKKENGEVKIEIIKRNLKNNKQRITTTKLQRAQAQFRSAFLALDKHCVVTGESLPDVLDAAHIISAKDGGSEVLQNGILLRTDIHRLYDANLFSIMPDGSLQVSSELSGHYHRLLNGKSLAKEVSARISIALMVVYDKG